MFKINSNIIKACIDGDEKTQMQLYDMYCDAMYTIAWYYLNIYYAKLLSLLCFKGVEFMSLKFTGTDLIEKIIGFQFKFYVKTLLNNKVKIQ